MCSQNNILLKIAIKEYFEGFWLGQWNDDERLINMIENKLHNTL